VCAFITAATESYLNSWVMIGWVLLLLLLLIFFFLTAEAVIFQLRFLCFSVWILRIRPALGREGVCVTSDAE
jgi:hypothetical protein